MLRSLAPENAIQYRLTCCDTEIWLTLRVIQPCMHESFNLMRRVGVTYTTTYPTF